MVTLLLLQGVPLEFGFQGGLSENCTKRGRFPLAAFVNRVMAHDQGTGGDSDRGRQLRQNLLTAGSPPGLHESFSWGRMRGAAE